MAKRPPFGGRLLTDKEDVFKHNAWDNVEWNVEQEEAAKIKVNENSDVIFSTEEVSQFEIEAGSHWSDFYSIHQNRFFKNRNWLLTEFPELAPTLRVCSNESNLSNDHKSNQDDEVSNTLLTSLRQSESFIGENSSFRVMEIGCGVGNTVFPLLEMNNDPNLFLYCCDFSETAIDIVKNSENYDARRCKAFLCDLTADVFDTSPFPEESLDIIVCIFVLSAISPAKIPDVVRNLAKYLKPGGMFLFRDYGRYDMAQLRFKKGRCLGDNFYARGDGTLCYFFSQEEVKKLMEDAGLQEVQNIIDRRLQVNRGKQLMMYRVWIQAKYKKP